MRSYLKDQICSSLLRSPSYGFIEVCVCVSIDRTRTLSIIVDRITAETANFETVLSLLSSFFVPEDENVFMNWIAKVAENKKMRSKMQSWRAEWKVLVASGRDGDALL